MSMLRAARDRFARMSLTRQVALLSLLPTVALGFVLARVLQGQIVDRALSDATRSAAIIAHLGVQPQLNPQNMSHGLSGGEVRRLDRQLGSPSVGGDLARIKVWNASDTVVYSEDHSLIGRTLKPSDDLEAALDGHPQPAVLVDPSRDSETASEVGLGELIEVYVPLRFQAAGRPAGAFEIYLSYKPLAAAIQRDKRTIALLLAVGLALLWAILYRILARASARLRRQARENHRLARYDVLTGLPNRNLFGERLKLAARRARNHEDGAPAVVLLDLERFSEINNTLGAANGDRVLRETAARIRANSGEGTAARLGGDEFAVLLPAVSGSEEALARARALLASIEEPLGLGEVELDIEAAAGVAVLGEHAEEAELLMRRADLALAHARSHGSRIEVYAPQLERSNPASLKLLGQVRGALARGEFKLHYQPKVLLSERRTVGVEALVRWEHPEHGLLAPERFIGLIEQTALITPLTLELLDQAIGAVVAWRARGLELAVSVNLSARSLIDPGLATAVGGLLARHGLEPDHLTLEVTESSAIADTERGVVTLERLRARGVGVSIDDFGTGNASIAYLANLPATELKIDRSFVTGVAADPRSQAIVWAALDVAATLGLTVVAEGIETASDEDFMRGAGCEYGQGYLYARPLPPDELVELLCAPGAPGDPGQRTAGAHEATSASGSVSLSRGAKDRR